MKNKNLVKLFFISSLLFIMACKAFMGGEAYADEKKEIDSLLLDISKLNNKEVGGEKKFKDYKDKINELKERFGDISDPGLKEKLLKLENLFQDKLAAKLAALKTAKQTIEGITDKDGGKSKIWSEAKLVGVTIKYSGSNTAGNGTTMSKDAVEQIDKIIKFLEEGTN
ncbi:fibronectin-binding protein RevA (plasmid) [Borreliella sinica]|uniref:fibronectin-binding protein RevA n=1 Tax=Borreliella sinica TaxID=87162 RepID=UPI003AF0F296